MITTNMFSVISRTSKVTISTSEKIDPFFLRPLGRLHFSYECSSVEVFDVIVFDVSVIRSWKLSFLMIKKRCFPLSDDRG